MIQQQRCSVGPISHLYGAVWGLFAFAMFAFLLQTLSPLASSLPIVKAEEADHQAYHGKPVQGNEFPWLSTLEDTSEGGLFCSAAFIGTRFLVTARHCFSLRNGGYRRPENIKALVGFLCLQAGNCNRHSQEVQVIKTYNDPRGGDMAIVELADNVHELKPAIPYLGKKYNKKQKGVKEKQTLTLVGAGLDGLHGDRVENAVKIKTKVISRDECKESFTDAEKRSNFVTKFTVCTKPKNGVPCQGDSGAALVKKGKGIWEKSDVIMAIHSWGQRDCSKENYDEKPAGHFEMIHASEYVMQVACESDFPPDWCDLVMSQMTPPNPVLEMANELTVHVPTRRPTNEPTFEPTPLPSIHPTVHPTSKSIHLPTSPPTLSPSTSPPTHPPSASPVVKVNNDNRCSLCFDGMDPTLLNGLIPLNELNIAGIDAPMQCSDAVVVANSFMQGEDTCTLLIVMGAAYCGCEPPPPDKLDCSLCADGSVPTNLEDGFVVGDNGAAVPCLILYSSIPLSTETQDECRALQQLAQKPCGCLVS